MINFGLFGFWILDFGFWINGAEVAGFGYACHKSANQ
jgi:hypothetical protein